METQDTKPWWKYGYVWMIIGGPLVVIIASFITFFYAVGTPDPVIENYYVKGLEINKTLEAKEALSPAMKARNHAQTGVTTP